MLKSADSVSIYLIRSGYISTLLVLFRTIKLKDIYGSAGLTNGLFSRVKFYLLMVALKMVGAVRSITL